MQAIERYGVVALLLLIGTVVAVLVWDGGPVDPANRVAAADDIASDPGFPSRRSLEREPQPAEPGRLRLGARPESRPLSRGGLQQVQGQPDAGYESRADGRSPTPWTPPPQAYDPGTWEEAARVEAGEFYAERQPEYYDPEPVVTPAYATEARPVPRREEPRPAQARKYEIRSGDTLGQISLDQLGTSKRWREIVELNPGLNAKKLYVGKKILIPADGKAPAEARPRPLAPSDPSTRTTPGQAGPVYVVRAGDNLWKIAARTLGDRERWHEIRDLNPSIDPDKIRVGQKLALPASARRAPGPIVASSTDTGTPQRRRVR